MAVRVNAKELLLGSVALGSAAFGVMPAVAQQAASATDQAQAAALQSAMPPENEVVVTGEAYAVERANDTKRRLGIVSDSISASEIGAIPEFGLGEALQRVPGVSFVVNNGRGEAQFMTLRGLNPDYNSVTLDGIQLPSTEETRRQFSFDVVPSIIANQVSVYKSYQADLPGDAIGGVTDLRSHSAFDHPGLFVAGHLDLSYWENERELHPNLLSGQGDVRASTTFGPDDRFGAIVLLSYYRRSSSSLNSYSLPYSYYGYTGGTQTVTATPLTPTTNVAGLTAIPDRRRWYLYDNVRERPGGYAKFEYNHAGLRAHLSTGFFQHVNGEYRFSQYLNRGAATASFTGPDAASFAAGAFETDYDHYIQYRNIRFAEAGVGYDLSPKTHVDAVFNYAIGFYRQDTTEDVFPTTTSAATAVNYVGLNNGIGLFQPAVAGAFNNPANYVQSYHLDAVDSSTTHDPKFRIDLTHGDAASDQGLKLGAGYLHRSLRQDYYYTEYRLNPVAGAAPTLAQTGVLNGSITPYNSGGLALLFLDPTAVVNYINGHPASYAPAASNLQRSTLNNFQLKERVDAAYAQASYRAGRLFAQVGLRYEQTGQDVLNSQPSPLTSTTNFIAVASSRSYGEPLPEANLSYDLADTLKLRAAASRTLARPRYSDLAQNQSLTLSGTTATETIANPDLKPRTSTNYDLSLEWYPTRAAALSVALFDKEIRNEIFTLTSTVQNTTLPGYVGSNYTLIITQAVNAGSARARGIELGANIARIPGLTGWLSHFGTIANVSFVDMDAPTIQMSDQITYRKLPQLLESAKFIANAALFYRAGRFNAEVAYNHTSPIPTSYDRTSAVNDYWYKATNTVDAQIAYSFIHGVEFRIQGKNLTNESNQRLTGPNHTLNYSLLENGRAYYAGVGFAF